MSERHQDERPATQARSPWEIGRSGYIDVAKRVKDDLKDDSATVLGAGIAFYFFLSLVPALIASISLWGLFADPQTITRQVREFTSALPTGAASLISDQMTSIASAPAASLGIGVIAGVAIALWSASSGVQALIKGIDVAYDEHESRGFLKLRGFALLLTAGAVVVGLVSLFLITVLPELLSAVALGDATRTAFDYLRWPVLALLMIVALAVLYRWGPDRDDPAWRWVWPGAALAVVVWLVASIAFSIYVSNFGSYNETYGSLAGVVVLMLWLFVTAFSFLLGAEFNAEIERQTVLDVTEEAPQAPSSESEEPAEPLEH